MGWREDERRRSLDRIADAFRVYLRPAHLQEEVSRKHLSVSARERCTDPDACSFSRVTSLLLRLLLSIAVLSLCMGRNFFWIQQTSLSFCFLSRLLSVYPRSSTTRGVSLPLFPLFHSVCACMQPLRRLSPKLTLCGIACSRGALVVVVVVLVLIKTALDCLSAWVLCPCDRCVCLFHLSFFLLLFAFFAFFPEPRRWTRRPGMECSTKPSCCSCEFRCACASCQYTSSISTVLGQARKEEVWRSRRRRPRRRERKKSDE